MKSNPKILLECFSRTLSHDQKPLIEDEASLCEASDQHSYSIDLLSLVAKPGVDKNVRMAAAINFKNHLRDRWAPATSPDEPNSVAPPSPIPNTEKDLIKARIVSVTVSATPKIQSQLSEAVAIICKHDFPNSWHALLPDLISRLQLASQASNYTSINGILVIANSIFKKFRYMYRTIDLLHDLKYCLGHFAAPLLEIFLQTAALIDSAPNSGGDLDYLELLFKSQRLCCRIFYSLNCLCLPEFFEDHMKEWMTEFKKYLTTSYPTPGLALVDELRAAVYKNINLYAEYYEVQFKDHLQDFLLAVRRMSSQNPLPLMAIKFLTIVSLSTNHNVFAENDMPLETCWDIVITNVMWRDEEEKLFKMDYVEFIRRDMEGSYLDTRRGIAFELLQGIVTYFNEQVTEFLLQMIDKVLAPDSVADWKVKDCAIYLFVSLAAKKPTGLSWIFRPAHFLGLFILMIGPELQSEDVNEFPVLKAGALKFLTMFRNDIPKQYGVQFLPDLIRFLGAESNVVHSYAAICIEKLLLVKDRGQPRYNSADITPLFGGLMRNLCNALKLPGSEENQYIMKCIMCVLGVADKTADIAEPSIAGLTSLLDEVCENHPRNPVFIHYLFESLAILNKRLPQLISQSNRIPLTLHYL